MLSPISLSQLQEQREWLFGCVTISTHLLNLGFFLEKEDLCLSSCCQNCYSLCDPTSVSSPAAAVPSFLFSWVVGNMCGNNRNRGSKHKGPLRLYLKRAFGCCHCSSWTGKPRPNSTSQTHDTSCRHWSEKSLQRGLVFHPPTSHSITGSNGVTT